MPSVDLDRRRAATGSRRDTPAWPWEDPALKGATAAVQEHLRRSCPGLLDPTDTGPRARAELDAAIRSFLSDHPALWPPGWDLDALCREVGAHVAGLGPLAALLERPGVSEVMANRYDDVWVEVEGRLERAPVRFRDEAHLFSVAQRVLAPLGVELSALHPLAEGRLPGNLRVAASVPPASPNTSLSLRLPALGALTTEEYVRRGSASPELLEFLQACARGRANLLIAGPTGGGKTTLLRYLGAHLDPGARLVVLEQVAELGLEELHPHVVSLEAHPPGPEGRGGVSLSDLLHHALHRRPDYLVVGEVLGPEALYLLMAMATGHPGACTVHAQSPARLFDRLVLAMLMARLEVSRDELFRQLCEAVDVVAFVERLADGSRKVTQVSEVGGLERGEPALRTIFRFHATEVSAVAVRGRFEQVAAPSLRLREKLARWGVYLP